MLKEVLLDIMLMNSSMDPINKIFSGVNDNMVFPFLIIKEKSGIRNSGGIAMES
jgi:hypothetical protein